MTKAMRDRIGSPVFVNEYGEYTYRFPKEDIVRRGNNMFVVYSFTGSHTDYTEHEQWVKTEKEALQIAASNYGSKMGGEEVFEVEVHEVD